MNQRTAILLALGLTVFVVVMVGGIVLSMQTQTLKVLAADATQTPAVGIQNADAQVGLAPTLSPTVPPTDAPSATPAATHVPASGGLAIPANSPISADRASQIALALIPGSKIYRTPQLVNYRGTMAYEVILSRAYVYVDAFNASVLARVLISSPTPTPTEFVPTPTPPVDTNTNSGGGNDGGGGGNTNNDGGGGGVGSPTDVPPPPGPRPTTAPPPKKHKCKDHDKCSEGGGEHDSILPLVLVGW